MKLDRDLQIEDDDGGENLSNSAAYTNQALDASTTSIETSEQPRYSVRGSHEFTSTDTLDTHYKISNYYNFLRLILLELP